MTNYDLTFLGLCSICGELDCDCSADDRFHVHHCESCDGVIECLSSEFTCQALCRGCWEDAQPSPVRLSEGPSPVRLSEGPNDIPF